MGEVVVNRNMAGHETEQASGEWSCALLFQY